MRFLLPVIFVAVGVIVSAVADVLLKEGGLRNHLYVVIAAALYAVTALPVAAAFKLMDFSVVFFVWEAIAVICGLALGHLLFKENISYFKILAFAFAILALVFSYLSSG